MKKYDVIVCGGGTAGVPAAIAAARNGAKTLVIEQYGHLGGTAVGGIPFLGSLDGQGRVVNKGLYLEILDRLKAENACFGYAQGAAWNVEQHYEFSLVPFDPEVYKYVAQEMILEAGGQILLHSYITDVKVEDGVVKAVEVCNKSGKEWYEAAIFADCTGDADVAAMAGAEIIPNEARQNCSILFRLGNVDLEEFSRDLEEGNHIAGKGSWHTRVIRGEKLKGDRPGLIHLAGHFVFGEDEPEVTFTAVSLRDGEVFLNASRVPGLCAFKGDEVSKAELIERKHVMELYRKLKANVPAFKNVLLVSTSDIGFRESRNILGDYILTMDDVLSARRFEDGVARGAYPIDIHDPKGGRTQFRFIEGGRSYEIPYRCLTPAGLKNVLVAGKTISATHEANGTTRIMACCVSQGEAVGTAAALCAGRSIVTRSLNAREVRENIGLDR